MEIATVPTLTGDRVTLEPLAAEHADDLRAAVADGDLWRTWYTSVPPPRPGRDRDRPATRRARGGADGALRDP